MSAPVAIVGAGLAGLCCARELGRRGVPYTIYEAGDAVGGRIRTDVVDGFRLDRGFQVLLTAYPEAQRVLDYAALDLRAFDPGARVWTGGGFDTVGDPFRRPAQALPTLAASVGSVADKLRVLYLRQSVMRPSLEALWQRPETSTARALRDRYGFSQRMVDRFFAPFLGGVLLDPGLGASSRAFEFYFRMFSLGSASVPNAGMQAIPEQIAAGLADGRLHLGRRAEAVEPGALVLDGGERVEARAVVVAVDASAAPALVPGLEAPTWKSTVQLAWAADEPPVSDPVLLLDGTGKGPVNNVQVMSAVAPGYAPPGRSLVTASVLGDPDGSDEALDDAARRQLAAWFGSGVRAWRSLPTSRVPHALPALPSLEPPERPVRLADGLYVAGDHRRNGSINGAMLAGRHAAEAVARDLA